MKIAPLLLVKAAGKKPMTDDEISTFMKSEFPDRRPRNFDHPNRARRYYNKGGFTGGKHPAAQSKRYDGEGNVIAPEEKKPKVWREEDCGPEGAQLESRVVPLSP